MKHFLRLIALLSLLVAPCHFAQSAETNAVHNFDKWEKEISAYERKDATNPPAKGSVVFIGSSTVARWKTLVQDFPDLPVVNRGFGGSQIVDATHFASRVVFRYEPKTVVLRAGGNDLWLGKSVEQVFADYKEFAEVVHAKLPNAKIVFISLSPSRSRWTQHEKEKAFNALVADFTKDKSFLQYIETYDVPLGADGLPRAELFVEDKLHFNADGYKLFTARIRPLLKP